MTSRSCTIVDCSRPHAAHGYCNPHYKKWRRYGDPLFEGRSVEPRGCDHPGCTSRHWGRGFCHMHYTRVLRHGDPSVNLLETSLEERFESKVERSPEPGCWEWRGGHSRHGYGVLAAGDPCISRLAHRVSYELFVGPIPDGLFLDHLCMNKNCVNPGHLEPVTHRENIRRAIAINGHSTAKLTWEAVREIREIGDEWMERWNVKPRTILEVLSRTTWRED